MNTQTDRSLPDDWLELAASFGSTKWLRNFITDTLLALHEQTLTPANFADAVERELQSRNLNTPAKQKNYRSNLVQALKVLDPNHPAIALVGLTTEQYRELNDAQRGKLADRETRYITSDQAEALVSRATNLLHSAEWSEVAAGLAVLIGRRISEILLSRFAPCTDWSVTFTGMAKKADLDELTIEIPTLAPAAQVLTAIGKLQRSLKIEDLKAANLSPRMAKQHVNDRFSAAVAAKCNQHYGDLVPSRSDRDDLYTHIFRAVYATIAAHWFCPPNVPEHLFKAEIQGHYTIAANGEKLPNYSARANYDDYAIGTQDGNRDGRLGIMLGKLPGLQSIAAFNPAASTLAPTAQDIPAEPIQTEQAQTLEEQPAMTQPTEKARTKRPELRLDDVTRMTDLLAKRRISGTPSELFHALLDLFEELDAYHQQAQSLQGLSASLNWFTQRIDTLETTCRQLQQERDRLQAATTATEELNQLRDENARLQQELKETQAQLLSVRQALGLEATSAAATQPATQTTTHTATPAPAYAATASDQPTPTPRPKTQLPASRSRGGAEAKINDIIDGLIRWNTAQEDPDTRLRISIPVIKAIGSAVGATYQPAIQQVLKHRAAELQQHHSDLLIGSRHNAQVGRKTQLLQTIAQDYLGLDNWQRVKSLD